jgi:protein AaeX
MIIKEISFAGVLFPPLLGYMAVAAVLWYALKYLLNRFGLYRYVWHPPLFNTVLYVMVLSALVVSTL